MNRGNASLRREELCSSKATLQWSLIRENEGMMANIRAIVLSSVWSYVSHDSLWRHKPDWCNNIWSDKHVYIGFRCVVATSIHDFIRDSGDIISGSAMKARPAWHRQLCT